MRDDEQAWRKVWLAGDVLLEIGLKRVQTSELGKDLLERIRTRLVQLLWEAGFLPSNGPRRQYLGALGDPRFRTDAWYLPDEPFLGFVEISAELPHWEQS